MSGHDLQTGRLLSEIEAGVTSQRALARRLGIALGLTNLLVRRVVSKGWVKATRIKANRVAYLITPEGISEKARLTYEFMDHSLRLYRETRRHLRRSLESVIRAGDSRVAIYGTGEPAELAYISMRELGLEPVAVFDGRAGGVFLGMPVRPISDHDAVAFDLMIVARLDHPGALIASLVGAGLSEDKLCPLLPAAKTRSASERPVGARRHNVSSVKE